MADPFQKRCMIFGIFFLLTLNTSSSAVSNDPSTVVKGSFSSAITSLHGTLQYLHQQTSLKHDAKTTAVLNDCIENIGSALDHVNFSLTHFSSSESDDVLTWLSAALTDQTTCLDGLQGLESQPLWTAQLSSSSGHSNTNLLSKALQLVTEHYASSNSRGPRRLLQNKDEAPAWVSGDHRRLLQANPAIITPNVVVAKDGSGKYKTIQAAVDSAPLHRRSPYIIKIKAGVYEEQVIVPKKAKNLVFMGDGINKTIITGSRNVLQSEVTTFNSATLIISGKYFLGRDITVQNTAGPAKNQAVAVMVNGDKVTFYHSQFEGFQDTLYAHSQRQFYRECTVLGSVDFIFGNGAVVLQNSTIMARVGKPAQQVTFTAQGRTHDNQTTGFSFHNCLITGDPLLKQTIAKHPCYLGRPWKEYSRTVFMASFLDSIINPHGWFPWSGDFALSTLFYGEYDNYGPGSSKVGRVAWSSAMTPKQASRFTVKSLIHGNKWIPSQVPLQLAL